MPQMFNLDMLPQGTCVAHALAGETVIVRVKEYLSSEDGNDFIGRLEGLSACYHAFFGQDGILPSQVDNFLAIVSPGREVTVYCNELNLIATIRKKVRSISKGDMIFKDDIADIERIELCDHSSHEVTIPPNCGFSLVLSHSWRKFLYYDYSVFGKDAVERADDLPALFGRFYARLLFQELYSMTEDQWRRLTSWGWFPFIGLTDQDRKALISWAQQDRLPLPVFESICTNVAAALPGITRSWGTHHLLQPHTEFIDNACTAYLAGNFIGAIAVLFPRIEGVLRTLHLIKHPTGSPKQSTMASGLAEQRHAESALLPHRFQQYLMDFYFQAFDEKSGDIPLSRHSVAHGIVRAEDCDREKATLGFLILDQIFYHIAV